MGTFRGARRRASGVAGCIGGAIVWIGLIASPGLGQAQGTPAITSSGLSTKVTPTVTDGGTTYSITGGTRPGNGANLFHSFGLFNLPGAGDSATFKNETGLATTNILGRVTEPQPSSIFGTIRTTDFGSANLFLINPFGWIFGATAALNVGGSFHVSTANHVLLRDGARFNAAAGPADALLTSAPPAAFGFSGPAGSISIQGSILSVDRGKTLSFVGGDVTIQAGALEDGTMQAAALTAPGGRIQIGSFAAEGEATVEGLDGAFARLGRVEISGGASISAAGDVRFDANGNPSVANGGVALIRGGQVDILGASLDVSGAQTFDADGNPLAGSPSGTVVIRGGRLFMDASGVMAQTFGNEPGGQAAIDIRMDESIRLANGTSLQSATFGKARGGDIQLTAGGTPERPGTIALETGSLALSMTTAPGRGGDVRLTAGSVAIDNAQIATLSLSGEGIGGDVTLKAGVVALTGGASIQSINQNATLDGRGGNITVQATDSVLISGQNDSGQASGLTTSTITAGSGGQILIKSESLTMQSATAITSNASFEEVGGVGGGIVIDVGRLSLREGATINSIVSASVPGTVLGGSVTVNVIGEAEIAGTNGGIFSIAFGAPPGIIAVRAGTLRLTGGALIQGGSFAGDSEGGEVSVVASDSIVIADRAGVSSQALNLDVGRVALSAPSLTIDRGFINTGTLGVGRAGDISIDVGTLTITRGGQIASSSIATASGGGGSVTIKASGAVAISGSSPGGESVLPEPFRGFIQDTASGIFSTASGLDPLAGAAGSIAISTPALYLSDGGKISASSTGSAAALAGNVNITFGDTLFMQGSSITTESLRADGGNIAITSTGSLLSLTNSQITTSVQSDAGAGGNITIGSASHSLDFVVLNNSQIRADAFGGPGGNIGIFADVYLTSGSLVSASSALSAPGTIDVQARITDLSGSLVQLPDNVLQAANLLRAACTARIAEGKASSLVVAGREGVPPEPEGLLWSPLDATLADFSAALGEEQERELFPRFAGVWLGSNCAR